MAAYVIARERSKKIAILKSYATTKKMMGFGQRETMTPMSHLKIGKKLLNGYAKTLTHGLNS